MLYALQPDIEGRIVRPAGEACSDATADPTAATG
jgi:hypothetical protein